MLGLKVGIVSCPDRSHGRGFVSGVGLSRVLEVRIRTAGTVDANVAGHADVRTAMGLAHDCDNSDLKSEKKNVLINVDIFHWLNLRDDFVILVALNFIKVDT